MICRNGVAGDEGCEGVSDEVELCNVPQVNTDFKYLLYVAGNLNMVQINLISNSFEDTVLKRKFNLIGIFFISWDNKKK